MLQYYCSKYFFFDYNYDKIQNQNAIDELAQNENVCVKNKLNYPTALHLSRKN